MKKLSGIILAVLLGIVISLGIAGCNAGTSQLQDKIDNLQIQLEEMNGKLSEIERLEAELAEINDRLAETEKQIEQLEKELAEQSSGSLYTLQEAYDNGWLTKEDLISIAYYNNRGREGNEDIMSDDYLPAPKTPEVLSSLSEFKIKNAAAKQYMEQHDKNDAKAEDFRITEYYGTYGDCIAVKTRDNYSGLLGIVRDEYIAGVYFCYNVGNEVQIWKGEKVNTEAKPVLPENCEAVVETTLYSGVDNCKDFIAICNSLDEFKEECLRNGYDFFDSSKENNYYNTAAGGKIREYTDEYFEDKAFVVCAFYKSSWSGQYRIEEVKVTADKLTLYIQYPRKDTANDVQNSVFLIAGIDKSLVSNVTNPEYVIR